MISGVMSMNEKKERTLLKKGIVIQEKEGVLIMKTLGEDKKTTKLSPELTKMILECEQDMIDALGCN